MLKTAMITAPVLQLPDFECEFTVTTDASEVSVGGILQQDFDRGLQPPPPRERWVRGGEYIYRRNCRGVGQFRLLLHSLISSSYISAFCHI